MRTVTGPWGSFRGWDADRVSTIIATGVFWDQQIQPAIDEADPSGWAIDLGANIGWFTVYMARRFAHVLAVEAHPGTCQLLRENIALHHVAHKVSVVEGAAYDYTTYLHMAPGEWHGWPIASETDLDQVPNAASLAWVPQGTGLSVAAFAVDDYVNRLDWRPLPRVTCLKVDCQGCDLRALKGCRQLIDRDRPLIIFEYEMGASQWHGDTWQDYEGFFTLHRYQITRIREDLWDYVARPL